MKEISRWEVPEYFLSKLTSYGNITLWLYDGQPVKVLNRLNDRQ